MSTIALLLKSPSAMRLLPSGSVVTIAGTDALLPTSMQGEPYGIRRLSSTVPKRLSAPSASMKSGSALMLPVPLKAPWMSL
jgi:hypothetical protein